MVIVDHGDYFIVRWEFDQWHSRNLAALKSLGHPHAKWDPVKKRWWVDALHKQQVYNLKYTHKANIIQSSQVTPELTGEPEPMKELEIIIPLKGQLREYQAQGVAQMMHFRGIMNGDEQGLGKTFQSIAAITGANAFPSLVVCPAAVKYNWQKEWHQWTDKKAIVLDSSMSASQRMGWFNYVKSGMADVVIVNYESVAQFFVEYYPQGTARNGKRKAWTSEDVVLRPFAQEFQSATLDESHRCKDPGTNQSKFIGKLFQGKKYRYLLSGTPIINKPRDLWPQLAIMGKLHLFGGKQAFLDRYCEGGTGANNLRELNYLLRKYGCFFRREKKEVAKDLPEKMRQTVICEISTRKEYDQAASDLRAWLSSVGFDGEQIEAKLRGEALVRLNTLRQMSARGKLAEAINFIQEVMDAGEKLVVFCNLHYIVDELLAAFPGAATITGRDKAEVKEQNKVRFQNDPGCRLIICNIKAAGVGVTLTASSRVAFIEYPLTWSDCVQCEDRCHRIGQVNNVMCTYFNGRNTIDERIWELIQEKKEISEIITGASDNVEMSLLNKTLQLFT